MRVELDVPESVTEPRMWVKHQPVLAMAWRRGSIEMGPRRSEMRKFTYDAGEMSLIPDRTLLRQTLTKGSRLVARGVHRARRKWQDHRLVRLLRWTRVQAHGFGFVFHRVGRALNRRICENSEAGLFGQSFDDVLG